MSKASGRRWMLVVCSWLAASMLSACGDEFDSGPARDAGTDQGGASGAGATGGVGGAGGAGGSSGAACDPGRTACGADGCVDTQSDPAHCGSCDNECEGGANATVLCNAGKCKLGGCLEHYADCDQLPDTGCEIDTRTSSDHCGACGNGCKEAPTGATRMSCQASACKCPAGRTQCGVESKIACVTAGSDPMFCGDSCSKCAPGQACGTGQCFTPQCPYGQIFCPAPGTCHNPDSDPTACGNCSTVCAYNQDCIGGVCKNKSAGCPPGTTQCFDNCPIVTTDSANCGSCGHACEPGEACMNGACQKLQLAAEPWQCPSGTVACAIPSQWPVKPAPLYCFSNCVFGGSPIPPGG